MKMMKTVMRSLIAGPLLLGLNLMIASPALAASPYIVGITRLNPAGPFTNATSVTFRVTFNESVSGVDVTDFTLMTMGTVTGVIASVSANEGTTVDVTVNSVNGDGDLLLIQKDSGTGIVNGAGDPIVGGCWSESITIDHTPPTVTIRSGYGDYIEGWVNTAEKAAGFRLSVDSSEGATCYLVPSDTPNTIGAITSSAIASGTYSIDVSANNDGLIDGKTYKVYAVDAAGNISVSAVAFTADFTPPTASVNVAATAGGDGWVNYEESRTGINVVARSSETSGKLYMSGLMSSVTPAGANVDTTLTIPSFMISDGNSYFVYAEDAAGNRSALVFAFTADLGVSVSIVRATGEDGCINIAEKAAGFQVVVKSNDAWVSFYFAPYSSSYTANTIAAASIASATSGGTGTDTVINVSANNDGLTDMKSYGVYAVDAAGNISGGLAAFWTDLTAPILSDVDSPRFISNSQKALGFSINVRGSESGTSYLVPSDTPNDIGAITRSAIASGTYSIDVSANNDGLLDGTTYKVYAVDSVGNVSISKTAFTTDFTPPTVSIVTSSTAGGDGYANFREYATGFDVVVQCSEASARLYLVPADTVNDIFEIQYAAVATATSVGAGENTTIHIASYSTGETVYRVYAIDPAGNISVPATAITVDFTLPTVSVNAGATAGGDGVVNIAEKTAGFNVVARSSESTGTLYLVPSATDSTITAITNAALASAASAGADMDTTIAVAADNTRITQGTSYVVYAVDAAGNISSPSATVFTADLTAPTVIVNSLSTAGGDGRVGIAEKESGFNAIAQSSEASGTLYLVPSGTASSLTAIASAAIASASSSGANSDTTIAVSANNAGVTDGTVYRVYAIDGSGNISFVPATAFTADLASPTGSVAYVRNGDNLLVTVTFSEAMSSTVTPKIAVDYTGGISGLSASDMTRVDAMTYTYSLSLPAGTGVGTVSLSNGTDLAGNPVMAAPTGGSSFIVDKNAPTVSLNPEASAGGDAWVNIAEKAAGFDVVARSSKGTGTLCLVPSSTASNLGAILSASIAGATSAGADADTTIHVSAGNPGVTHGMSYRVYAIDESGNISTVSGVAFTADLSAPAVSSVGVPANGTYLAGQNLDFTVNFNENVTIDTSGGTPYITVALDSGAARAYYVGGSGTTALTFRYTVVSGDFDNDGIGVTGGIAANNGTLKDAAGNDAGSTLNNIGDARLVRVDAAVPAVVSINRQTPAGTLTNAGSVIYRVTFNKSVTGVDAGDFALTATGTVVGSIASVSAGSGTSIDVTVSSIIGDGDLRLDLKTSGTGIADSWSTAISGGFTAGQSYTLDHTAPTVSTVTVPVNGNYLAGQSLDFTVNFSENITVDTSGGVPYLPVVLNVGGTVHASYISGSGTSALVFRYTVVNGHNDPDGIGLGAIVANGGQFRDTVGNSANLTLNGVGSTVGVLVDAVVPAVTSVAATAGAYGPGRHLEFTVNFNKPVTVDTTGGQPYINVMLDSGLVRAVYFSGSGTSALVFRYTVLNGDSDADGVAMESSITFNGGTLRDASGNNVSPTLTYIGGVSGMRVDTAGPEITFVKPTDGASLNTNNGSMVIVSIADLGSGIDASSIELQIDGGSWMDPISFAGNNAYFLLDQLSNGSHTLTVRVRDIAGNETVQTITITWNHYRRGFGFGRFSF